MAHAVESEKTESGQRRRWSQIVFDANRRPASSFVVERQDVGSTTTSLIHDLPCAHIKHTRDVVRLILNRSTFRLLVVVVIFIICGYVELFAEQWSDSRFVGQPVKTALRDLFFDILPYVPNTAIVNNLMIATIITTFAYLILLLPTWSHTIHSIRRFVAIMAWLYLFRASTILCTTIPSPYPQGCTPSDIELYGSVRDRFWFATQSILGGTEPCTNNIYSGHTSIIMSSLITWRSESRLRWWWDLPVYLAGSSAILMILFTRFHYSIDVILAIFIAGTSWFVYLAQVEYVLEDNPVAHQRPSQKFIPFGLTHLVSFLDGLDISNKQPATSNAIEAGDPIPMAQRSLHTIV